MTASYARRNACALCAAPQTSLTEVMALAPTPPANEFVSAEELARPQERIPLTLLLCSRCGHLQLAAFVRNIEGKRIPEFMIYHPVSNALVASVSPPRQIGRRAAIRL